jgi:hypothetical protein
MSFARKTAKGSRSSKEVGADIVIAMSRQPSDHPGGF